jgi:hypothetical protein
MWLYLAYYSVNSMYLGLIQQPGRSLMNYTETRDHVLSGMLVVDHDDLSVIGIFSLFNLNVTSALHLRFWLIGKITLFCGCNIQQGVKQGGLLSADLYKLYIEDLLHTFQEMDSGAQIGDITVNAQILRPAVPNKRVCFYLRILYIILLLSMRHLLERYFQ